MKKQDPVVIGTASVVAIALSLSLVTIYVLPNIYYNIKIYRNTDKPWQIALIEVTESIDGNSTLFDQLNRTSMLEHREHMIINITNLFITSEMHIGYVNTFTTVGALAPKRIKLIYNGTILSVANNATFYAEQIRLLFVSPCEPTYLAFMNSSGDYEVYSSYAFFGTENISFGKIDLTLENLFADPNTRPDFVIYQDVSYLESYGLFREYSTQFIRMVFINAFGDVLFFIGSDGKWQTPLLFE
ncbi:MAG: hypothetical protein ACTSYD_06950 [Candidatus Heimdallarchaeaceae archaeon]